MTPPTATAPRREAQRGRPGGSADRRRSTMRRRRRTLAGLLTAIAVVVVVVLAMPLARRAVNDLGLPLQYQNVIRQQAGAKRLDPALIAAVIYAETKFDPRTSSAGAVGLMQILPQTAEFLAHRSGATTFTTADLSTARVNISYGSYYLRYLLDEYHGSRMLAVAAYNGGEANVDHWVADARAHGHQLSIAQIPFPETRAYVQRVLSARSEYRHKYASQLGYN
ncbi:MAG: lytic transglycosylase domain-containing protein [Solirubrobacteraceae bacterium]